MFLAKMCPSYVMCMLEINSTDVVCNERNHLDVRTLEKGKNLWHYFFNTKINRNSEVGNLVLHLKTSGL